MRGGAGGGVVEQDARVSAPPTVNADNILRIPVPELTELQDRSVPEAWVAHKRPALTVIVSLARRSGGAAIIATIG